MDGTRGYEQIISRGQTWMDARCRHLFDRRFSVASTGVYDNLEARYKTTTLYFVLSPFNLARTTTTYLRILTVKVCQYCPTEAPGSRSSPCMRQGEQQIAGWYGLFVVSISQKVDLSANSSDCPDTCMPSRRAT